MAWAHLGLGAQHAEARHPQASSAGEAALPRGVGTPPRAYHALSWAEGVHPISARTLGHSDFLSPIKQAQENTSGAGQKVGWNAPPPVTSDLALDLVTLMEALSSRLSK